jgi:hypothetical protein
MRKTYEIGGMKFEMRMVSQRDMIRTTGKIGLLATDVKSRTPQSVGKAMDFNDRILSLCAVSPKIVLDDPDVVADGVMPVSEIPDAIYDELMTSLFRDSGFSKEAADEVRPSSATDAAS